MSQHRSSKSFAFNFASSPCPSSPEDAANELNRFLAVHRILSIDHQLVSDGPNSAWTICVSFDDGNGTAAPRSGIVRRACALYAASLSSSSNVAGQASGNACGGWPSIVAGNARSAWR